MPKLRHVSYGSDSTQKVYKGKGGTRTRKERRNVKMAEQESPTKRRKQAREWEAHNERMKEGREWAKRQEEQQKKRLEEIGYRNENLHQQGYKMMGQIQKPQVWDRPETRAGKSRAEMMEEKIKDIRAALAGETARLRYGHETRSGRKSGTTPENETTGRRKPARDEQCRPKQKCAGKCNGSISN